MNSASQVWHNLPGKTLADLLAVAVPSSALRQMRGSLLNQKVKHATSMHKAFPDSPDLEEFANAAALETWRVCLCTVAAITKVECYDVWLQSRNHASPLAMSQRTTRKRLRAAAWYLRRSVADVGSWFVARTYTGGL